MQAATRARYGHTTLTQTGRMARRRASHVIRLAFAVRVRAVRAPGLGFSPVTAWLYGRVRKAGRAALSHPPRSFARPARAGLERRNRSFRKTGCESRRSLRFGGHGVVVRGGLAGIVFFVRLRGTHVFCAIDVQLAVEMAD